MRVSSSSASAIPVTPAATMLGVSMRASSMSSRRSTQAYRPKPKPELDNDDGAKTRATSRRRGTADSTLLYAKNQRSGTRTTARDHAASQDGVVSRPAVFTGEGSAGDGLLDRLRALRSSGTTTRASSRRTSRERDASAVARGLSAPSLPILFLVAISVALGVMIFMGPAREYYASWRDEGILEAQYKVASEQYSDLQHDIERLQTVEGIEDLARKRGYAYPDEEALVVQELEEQEFVGTVSLEDAVKEHEANLPWYVGVLDVVFDYQYE